MSPFSASSLLMSIVSVDCIVSAPGSWTSFSSLSLHSSGQGEFALKSISIYVYDPILVVKNKEETKTESSSLCFCQELFIDRVIVLSLTTSRLRVESSSFRASPKPTSDVIKVPCR